MVSELHLDECVACVKYVGCMEITHHLILCKVAQYPGFFEVDKPGNPCW